jgi:transcriptional regulator with XRE-family HTH domain
MRKLCAAGAAVEAWLRKHERSRAWLAEQLGVDRAVLWRWLMGQSTPRVDFALSIQRITSVSAGLWRTERLAATGTSGRR